MSPVRYFSLEEANRAIQAVAPLLVRLRELHTTATQAKERLDMLWQRLDDGEAVLDEISGLQHRLDADTEEYAAILGRLDQVGCLLRDVDMGLVDFPAIADGTEIYLCWRLGEEAIGYWHGLREGFSGRKAVVTMPGSRLH